MIKSRVIKKRHIVDYPLICDGCGEERYPLIKYWHRKSERSNMLCTTCIEELHKLIREPLRQETLYEIKGEEG